MACVQATSHKRHNISVLRQINCLFFSLFGITSWWRHQIEFFSALLALCEGNHLWPVNSPHKGQWHWALTSSLIGAWTKGRINIRNASDSRRHYAHYDVTVMIKQNDGFTKLDASNAERVSKSLQWRHNGRDSVSNHQPHGCLLNRLFKRKSNKTSKFLVTGLCAGNSPGTGEFPEQMASNAENVSIWWRHHVMTAPCGDRRLIITVTS